MPNKKVVSTRILRENETEYGDWPSLSTQTENFRKAFAIVGTLIATGAIEIGFDARGWHDRFECLVLDVAQTLNTLAS